jgi:hypothetical protein
VSTSSLTRDSVTTLALIVATALLVVVTGAFAIVRMIGLGETYVDVDRCHQLESIARIEAEVDPHSTRFQEAVQKFRAECVR